MPRASNHWGLPKSPNNVASFFFNTVHLLPKGVRFEHGAPLPNLFLTPGASSLRYAPVSHRGLFKKILSQSLAPGIIFLRSLPKIHDHVSIGTKTDLKTDIFAVFESSRFVTTE